MGVGHLLSSPFRALQQLSQAAADCLEGSPRASGAGRPASRRRRGAAHRERRPAMELLRDLRHRRGGVRARAARQLGEMGLWEATEELVRASNDPKREVRRAALSALLEVDPEKFADAAVALAQRLPRAELFADFDAMLDAMARARRSQRIPDEGIA